VNTSVVRVTIRQPKRTLAAALLLLAIGTSVAAISSPKLSSAMSDYDASGSDVYKAQQDFFHVTGINTEEGLVALVKISGGWPTREDSPVVVKHTIELLRRLPEVRAVTDYSSTGNRKMISRNGRITYVAAALGDIDQKPAVKELRRSIASDPILRDSVIVGGPTAANVDIAEVSTKDLGTAESVALPLMVIALLLVFRGVVAAMIPLSGALFSIVIAFIGIGAAMQYGPVSIFALNLMTALGLGLSIDFSLLIVTRFREELATGKDVAAAIERVMATAGRTVGFSATIVAAAMASLVLFPQPFLSSMGLAGASVAISAAIFALLVLPAILGILGGRVNALAPQSWQLATRVPQNSGWFRVARRAMQRPFVCAASVACLLVAISSAFLHVSFSGYDASILPDETDAGRVYATLASDFENGTVARVILVVAAGSDQADALSDYTRRLAEVPGVEYVSSAQQVSPLRWKVDVTAWAPALSDRARDTVHRLEHVHAPGPVEAIGETRRFDNLLTSVKGRLPFAVGLMGLLSMALVFGLTRSPVLAVKNVVMNLLTIGASFGILVIVFQWGWLGLGHVGTLEATSLIIAGVLASALSTDYGIFLLSRIKEERESGYPDNEAVAIGLGRIGPVVSAAAVLLFIPLSALMFSELAPLRQLGVGAALAVLIDATVIRGVLVPALMALLRRWNWPNQAPIRRRLTPVGEPTTIL
jgi:uncharacterized membrane protein YdfJ with MMPL/SSD domain